MNTTDITDKTKTVIFNICNAVERHASDSAMMKIEKTVYPMGIPRMHMWITRIVTAKFKSL